MRTRKNSVLDTFHTVVLMELFYGHLEARNVVKANSEIVKFNFATLIFIVTGKLFYTRILYILLPFLLLKELLLSLSSRRYDVSLSSSNPSDYLKALVNLHLSANF